VAGNCTLKADYVCSKFLQDGIPVPEGIPSIPAISYIDTEGVCCSRMILRYCPDPVLVPRVVQRCERSNGKDTHKVPRQYSHPFLLRKIVLRSSSSEMLIPCPEEQDVKVQVIALLLQQSPPPRPCPCNRPVTSIYTGMSRYRRSRTHKAQRDVHRASRTRVSLSRHYCNDILATQNFLCLQARTRDVDQIQLIDLDPKVCHLDPRSAQSDVKLSYRIGQSWKRRS
jgi:hypothetical protein